MFNIMNADGIIRMKKKNPIRIRWYNCGKYGAVQIGFRRLSVMKNAICFNQLFGGGTVFTAGEDTMFIRECIRKGLKVVAVPDCILRVLYRPLPLPQNKFPYNPLLSSIIWYDKIRSFLKIWGHPTAFILGNWQVHVLCFSWFDTEKNG